MGLVAPHHLQSSVYRNAVSLVYFVLIYNRHIFSLPEVLYHQTSVNSKPM